VARLQEHPRLLGREIRLLLVLAGAALLAQAPAQPAPQLRYPPDGKRIYFTSGRSGGWDLWRLPAEGAGPTDAKAERITSHEMEDWRGGANASHNRSNPE
jgi:hypothetical protein